MANSRHKPKPKMGEVTHDESINDDIEWVSKSEMKREAARLDALAAKLVAMPAQQLPGDLLSDGILKAIKEARRLTKADAVRRQTRHVGRLLQQLDTAEAIQARLDLYDPASETGQQIHRLTEQWRDRLTSAPEALAGFMDEYPVSDRQALHQAVRQAHQAEMKLAEQPEDEARAEVLRRQRHHLYQSLQPLIRQRIAETG